MSIVHKVRALVIVSGTRMSMRDSSSKSSSSSSSSSRNALLHESHLPTISLAAQAQALVFWRVDQRDDDRSCMISGVIVMLMEINRAPKEWERCE